MRCPVGTLRTTHRPRGLLRFHEAPAGSVRSEHRNVDILIPLARQRESSAGPNVPCERRTEPAEPPPLELRLVSGPRPGTLLWG